MGLSAELQKNQKLAALRQGLLASGLITPEVIAYNAPPPGRDRVDLIFAEGKYGFYQKGGKSLFEIQECPQMSAELFSFFSDLKKIILPIKKGSLRLRVSANKEFGPPRGLWLDFANTDIQSLFEEKKTLHQLLDLAFIEIGQRKKKLEWDGNRFRLKAPEFHPWTRTWIQGKAYPLDSVVGSFSQTSDQANQMIMTRLESQIAQTTAQHWTEFGSGNGNLTLPLAGEARLVTALEYDPLALQGFKRTLERLPQFQQRIQLIAGDFQSQAEADFLNIEGLLLNPPRSGVQKFLDPLINKLDKPPKDLIYVSCFLDSFCRDSLKLQELCYTLSSIEIIDQFPETPHFEILSRWFLN